MNKKIIDNITQLIGNTPLLKLTKIVNLSESAEILGKLESLNPGGSIKERACLFMIEEAERKGTLKPDATIIEPTTGNTGIGLAMICAVKGYKCIITMPEAFSLERNYLLRTYGAKVVLTPTRLGMKGSIEKAEKLAKNIPNSFIPRQFENEANAEAHRRTTGQEILDACEGHLDAFVAGIGTGGTITGVGEVLRKSLPNLQIIAVEPKRSAVLMGKTPGQHNIQGLGAGFIPKILNRELIDEIIPVDDKDAFNMTRRLGKEEGICVGISSGAAVIAALKVAKELGPGKRVVTIFADTGERYFSTEQYFEA